VANIARSNGFAFYRAIGTTAEFVSAGDYRAEGGR
jgi:hypothetical protein